MKPADERQCTCQGTDPADQPPNVRINHLPDELLLEIFDLYRQDIDLPPCLYMSRWNEEYGWFNLAHVCRKWRAVMFASPSRLDFGITVGPEKPGHIETILSGPPSLPILVKYGCTYRDVTDSAIWRMRTALKHQDRVREIGFEGTSAWFDEFFKATNCPFPVLENLRLHRKYGDEVKLPDTFLGGPDLSYLHLRRLKLDSLPLSSISGILLSATALVNFSLLIDIAFSQSPETTLLACLQGMPRLRNLRLFITSESPSQPSTSQHTIVPLSKLTSFGYLGRSAFLDALVAGLSGPSLLDVSIAFVNPDLSTIVQLPRFINEIEEHYHAFYLTFGNISVDKFRFSLLTKSEYINHCVPRFKLGPIRTCSSESIMPLSAVLSTKLVTVEVLHVTFEKEDAKVWEHLFPWRRFYQQFPSVKALRTESANVSCVARTLLQGHEAPDGDLAFLPALEEIGLVDNPSLIYASEHGREVAAFQPFVSARQQAGRPVKVFFSR